MAEIDLQQRFPEMTPVRKAPTLSRINGIGMTMHGVRDADQETGTYVKTQCLTLLFLPLFMLKAYRVADAEGGGWYFLGRVPLSPLARGWNFAMAVLLISAGVIGGWSAYTGSPEYRAAQKLAEADRLAEAGDLQAAAEHYRDLATGTTSQAQPALAGFTRLLETHARQADANAVADALVVAVKLQTGRHQLAVVPDLVGRGIALADHHKEADPQGALRILEAVAPLGEQQEDLLARRRALLGPLVEAHPDDMELAVELALLAEQEGDFEQCLQLLSPHADQLGDSEGARLLGQVYAARGDYGHAYALLGPYTEQRLERLTHAETAYNDAYQSAYDRVFNELNEGKAPQQFYVDYEAAGPEQQNAMVNDYVQDKLVEDATLEQVTEKLIDAAAVVPVALDLGLVQLQLAQAQTDPDERRRELESAEKTFLSVRGVAGDEDAYMMNLGQVYYWLGRHDEGRALLDGLLEKHNHSTDAVQGVALILREVGRYSDAQRMIEQAYQQADDQRVKYRLARIRAAMLNDTDDELFWLKLADPADPEVRAALHSAQGAKALSIGDKQQAEQSLRLAIAAYDDQTRTAGTLNNSALACTTLYSVSRDPADMRDAARRIEQALSLSHSDSILLKNAHDILFRNAVMQLVGDRIDLAVAPIDTSLDAFSYLYNNEEQRDALMAQLRGQAGVQRSITLLERASLLSPKSPGAYSAAGDYYFAVDDTVAMRRLVDRLEQVELDTSLIDNEMLAVYRGERESRFRQATDADDKRWRRAIEQARAGDSPATLAVAVDRFIDTQYVRYMLGDEADGEELVALAEEAYAADPSRASENALIAALLTRAALDLAETQPGLARSLEHTHHTLVPSYVLVLLLNEGGDLSARIQEHPDVRRATALYRDSLERFPETTDPWIWALLRLPEPEAAERIRSNYQDSELRRLHVRVQQQVAPLGVYPNLRACWAAQMAGDDGAAADILRRLRTAGIPLPVQ